MRSRSTLPHVGERMPERLAHALRPHARASAGAALWRVKRSTSTSTSRRAATCPIWSALRPSGAIPRPPRPARRAVRGRSGRCRGPRPRASSPWQAAAGIENVVCFMRPSVRQAARATDQDTHEVSAVVSDFDHTRPMPDQPTASAFRLGDLLDHEELGLALLTGGAEARRRRVAGAHSIEIERPTTWLEPEWIMLTTGARLRRSARAQRELIAELETAGASALGFGVEVVFRRVPTAALAEARTRGFPVFSIPLATPFRDVISTINRALLSTDLRTLQRLSSMQLYLMDALSEADPQQAVVERLSAFLDATVLLFSPHGALIASTGDAPAAEIWREVNARPATVVEMDLDGWHVLATPISAGRAAGWLAVASRRAPPSGRLARQAARATAPVLPRWAAWTRWRASSRRRSAPRCSTNMLKPPRPRPKRQRRSAGRVTGRRLRTPPASCSSRRTGPPRPRRPPSTRRPIAHGGAHAPRCGAPVHTAGRGRRWCSPRRPPPSSTRRSSG